MLIPDLVREIPQLRLAIPVLSASEDMKETLPLIGVEGHPADDLLEQFVLKTTSAGQAQAVAKHIEVCGNCRARLRGTEDWVALVKVVLALDVWDGAPELQKNFLVTNAESAPL